MATKISASVAMLDAIKQRLSLRSDYALAKAFGMKNQSAICNYRAGRSQFDEDTAIRAAELLEECPAVVLAKIAAERAKTPKARAVWRDAVKRLSQS